MTKQSKWAALLTFFAVFFLLAGILVPLLLITFGQDDIGLDPISETDEASNHPDFQIEDKNQCPYLEKYIGDSICDDLMNNKECRFDGGDCCSLDTECSYCTNCICHSSDDIDGNVCKTESTTTEPKGNLFDITEIDFLGGIREEKGCSFYFLGDGKCDGLNNVKECHFDGGDCCIEVSDCKHCDPGDCICHETSRPHSTVPWSTGAEACVEAYKGDGGCDSDNNIEACGYDGGDCCDYSAQCFCWDTTVTSGDCLCHLDGQKRCSDDTGGSIGFCLISEDMLGYFNGDGVCDDLTNTEECGFDGCDCCLDSSNFGSCYDCQCTDEGHNHCGTMTSYGTSMTPLMTSSTTTYDPDALVNCLYPSWVQDGWCDDMSNTLDCFYDGGDCCNPNAKCFCGEDCDCHNTGTKMCK